MSITPEEMDELRREKLREDRLYDLQHSKPEYTHNYHKPPWERIDYDEDEDSEEDE